MAKYTGTLMKVCISKANHSETYRELKECRIYDDMTLEQLVNEFLKIKKELANITANYNDLTTKFNALQAAYKANNAKVALEILESKNN